VAALVHRLAFLLAAVLCVLIPAVARTGPLSYPGASFGMLGITTAESARVNALNLGNGSSGNQLASCDATLQFLDAHGQLLKQRTVTLQAGKAASLDISREELPAGDDARAEIRAVVLFGYFGGANPPPAVRQKFDCNFVLSLEVFDNDTKKTSFLVSDVKQLPPPSAPAQ
jgi:hypothetical protein